MFVSNAALAWQNTVRIIQKPEVMQDVLEAGKVWQRYFSRRVSVGFFRDRGKPRGSYERVSGIRFSVLGYGAQIRRRTDRLTCGLNAVVGSVAVKVLAPATASSV